MRKIITLLALAVLTATASAVEYVTLTSKTTSKAIPSGSLVEIVSWGASTLSKDGQQVKLTFADGEVDDLIFAGAGGSTDSPVSNRRYIFAGLTRVEFPTPLNYRHSITLKITSEAELKEVTSGVVTLPAITGQGYAVTLEHSTDLANWQPVAPGEFTGTVTPQFFRVRLKNAPETPE